MLFFQRNSMLTKQNSRQLVFHLRFVIVSLDRHSFNSGEILCQLFVDADISCLLTNQAALTAE